MARLRSPALDPQAVPARRGSSYPAPFRAEVETREKRPLGDALGLSQFGVNLVLLPPGCWSSQRHWHTHEDEFVYVLEGELTLVTDAGEQLLRPGMAAGFPGRQGRRPPSDQPHRPAGRLSRGRHAPRRRRRGRLFRHRHGGPASGRRPGLRQEERRALRTSHPAAPENAPQGGNHVNATAALEPDQSPEGAPCGGPAGGRPAGLDAERACDPGPGGVRLRLAVLRHGARADRDRIGARHDRRDQRHAHRAGGAGGLERALADQAGPGCRRHGRHRADDQERRRGRGGGARRALSARPASAASGRSTRRRASA